MKRLAGLAPRPAPTPPVGTAWTFEVPGPPVPKGRPRVTRGRTFTPERTVAYEQTVHLMALAAGVRAGLGPVSVEARIWPADRRRIDLDNVLKALLDGLARPPVLFGDHWEVVRRVAIEAAGVDARRPRVEVTVTVISGVEG